LEDREGCEAVNQAPESARLFQRTFFILFLIQVALIHQRPSEGVEGISAGPLAEILNYTTGISFEGFTQSESKTYC
jgi:hypothetical protein